MSPAVCRVCLVSEMKMYRIENQEIQKLYEKLTNTKLSAEDQMPESVCYICYSLLQKCCRFSNLAHQSEQILRNQLKTGNQQITCDTTHPCSVMNLVKIKNLSVTIASSLEEDYLNKNILQHSSGNVHDNNYFCVYEDTSTSIKIETEEINVKVETNSEDEGLLTSTVKTEKCVPMGISNTKNNRLLKPGNTHVHKTLQSNKEPHVKDNPYFCCDVCKQMFSSKYHLQMHMKSHTGKNLYSCNKCNKSFSKIYYLRKHIQICSATATMICLYCTQTFTDIDQFEDHLKTHSDEKQYICSRCSQVFKKSSLLRYHMKSHTGIKPYTCNACGKSFKEHSQLKTHSVVHKDRRLRPFKCDICGKTYPVKGSLTMHMRSHTGERPYLCNTCGMKFAYVGVLKQHIRRLHTEVKAYACSICFLSFNHEIGLTRHMRNHNEERRPYSCDLCSKTFGTAGNLKEHVRVHTGERPYSCNRCGNTYKQSKHLSEHQKTMKCRTLAEQQAES